MVELDTTIPYQDGDTSGIPPNPALEESADSLSVPASDPTPSSPLDQAGRDFHIPHRQGPGFSVKFLVAVWSGKINHVLLGLRLILLLWRSSLYCICGIWMQCAKCSHHPGTP